MKLTDYSQSDSVSFRTRARRFQTFLDVFEALPKPVKILDVGGTQLFWETFGFAERDDIHVTLLNLFQGEVSNERFTSVVGDARNLSQYADGAFDVVFSNSVIEHLRNFEGQQQMADEVRRVGRAYFVQTPNYYFPIEPHFVCPAFHFMPKWIRENIVQTVPLGTYRRAKSLAEARDWVEEIRLLSKREFASLFPDAEIKTEWYCGLPKSFMAVRNAS